MTATEVLERRAQMSRLLGATYGRLQTELLTPLVMRCVAILRRRGEIPDIVAGRQDGGAALRKPAGPRAGAAGRPGDAPLFLEVAGGARQGRRGGGRSRRRRPLAGPDVRRAGRGLVRTAAAGVTRHARGLLGRICSFIEHSEEYERDRVGPLLTQAAEAGLAEPVSAPAAPGADAAPEDRARPRGAGRARQRRTATASTAPHDLCCADAEMNHQLHAATSPPTRRSWSTTWRPSGCCR